MSDTLTVRSPGAGANEAQAPNEGEGHVDAGAKAQRDQLERLRELAKERHGKVLTDKVLLGIVQRHNEQVREKGQAAEVKAAFEAELAQESVGSASAEAKVQKATGVQKARGADGLSEQERQQISGNPKAGPRLPPTEAKATTPEQAQRLLGKMLTYLMVDGQPLDLTAYADGLKPEPPTQAKGAEAASRPQDAALRGGGAPGQAGTRPGEAPPPGERTQGQAMSRSGEPVQRSSGAPTRGAAPPALASRSPTTLPRTMGPTSSTSAAFRPGALPPATNLGHTAMKAGGVGGADVQAFAATQARAVAKAGALGSIAMKAGGVGGAEVQARAAAEVANAGGGLLSSVDFDGMTFNWEAFFMKFIVTSQRDLAVWRRAMHRMRALAAKGAFSMQEAQIVFTQVQNELESASNQTKMASASTTAYTSVKGLSIKGLAGEPSLSEEQEALPRLGQTLESLGDKAPADGRTWLSSEELSKLPKESREAYLQAQRRLEAQLGRVGYQAYLRAELGKLAQAPVGASDKAAADGAAASQASKASGAVRAALAQEIATRAPNVQRDLERAAQDGDIRNALRTTRDHWRGRIDRLEAELKDLELRRGMAKTEGGDAEAKLAQEHARKLAERVTAMRTVVELDNALAGGLPRNEEVSKVLKAQLALTKDVVLPADLPADAPPEVIASAYERERLLHLSDPVANPDGAAPRPMGSRPAPAEIAALEGQLRAGRFVGRQEREHEAGLGDKIGAAAQSFVTRPLSGAVDALERGIDSGPFAEAVNRGVQTAVNAARSQRKQLDGKCRQATMKAQGMINQLANMIRLSHTA